MHFDTTISLGSILVVLGFLLALTKIATRSMIKDELEKHAGAFLKLVDAVVSDAKAHAAEDDNRFQRITDKLERAVESLGEIREAGHLAQRQEQRIDDLDGRLKELVGHVDARFAEDRKIAHDRVGGLQPFINRTETRLGAAEATMEQIRQRLLGMETVQRLTPSEQPQ